MIIKPGLQKIFTEILHSEEEARQTQLGVHETE
jgi:hypothetical protein